MRTREPALRGAAADLAVLEWFALPCRISYSDSMIGHPDGPSNVHGQVIQVLIGRLQGNLSANAVPNDTPIHRPLWDKGLGRSGREGPEPLPASRYGGVTPPCYRPGLAAARAFSTRPKYHRAWARWGGGNVSDFSRKCFAPA